MSFLVTAQASIYPDFVSIYIPKEPVLKGFVRTGSGSMANMEANNILELEFSGETPIERSIRRTKKKVKDYILCNQFSIFATFTFKDNRYDIDEKRRQMSNWLKNQQKRNGSFQYIAIPELHSDGALHFHALLTDYSGKIKEAINPKTGKTIIKYGQQFFYFPEYTLGFSNFRFVNQSPEDHLKIAYYVSKYITKDMPIFKNKKRYFASKGLKSPIVIDNPSDWYKQFTPNWEKKTLNGKIMRFARQDNSEIEKFLGV